MMAINTLSGKILVWDLGVRIFHWFLVLVVIIAFSTSLIERLLPYHSYRSQPTLTKLEAGITPKMQLYFKVCGECHFEFPPSLLPAKSWELMMNSLEKHFGEDATLSARNTKLVLDFLTKNAAEKSKSEASYKISRSLNEVSGMQISKSAFWIKKHSEVKKEVYKRKLIRNRLNCVACHPQAKFGSFEDGDIDIPN